MDDNGKFLLIINPVSGTDSKKDLAERLVARFRQNGFEADVAFTEYAGHGKELASQALKKKYCGIIACGGDGTVNEIASALVGSKMPLGIIPVGSGNGLARHACLPMDPLKAVDVIVKREIKDCDYAVVNGKPFFCTFGVGFDASVSERFAAAKSRGKSTYIKCALKEFVNFRPEKYKITADGEDLSQEAIIVAVCNANQYGNNAFIAPEASITDGFLDLIIVKKSNRANIIRMSMDMMSGTLARNPHIVHRQIKEVIIERDSVKTAQLDGESNSHFDEKIHITCVPGELRLFVNRDKKIFKAILTPMQNVMSDMAFSIKKMFKK